MSVIITKKYTITSTSSGYEKLKIFGPSPKKLCGYLKQIIIRQSSGTATTLDLEVRYEPGVSDAENLVYGAVAIDVTSSYIESGIDATFSLLQSGISGSPAYTYTDDLQLYIEPDATGTFEIRVDFEILNAWYYKYFWNISKLKRTFL